MSRKGRPGPWPRTPVTVAASARCGLGCPGRGAEIDQGREVLVASRAGEQQRETLEPVGTRNPVVGGSPSEGAYRLPNTAWRPRSGFRHPHASGGQRVLRGRRGPPRASGRHPRDEPAAPELAQCVLSSTEALGLSRRPRSCWRSRGVCGAHSRRGRTLAKPLTGVNCPHAWARSVRRLTCPVPKRGRTLASAWQAKR